VSASTTTSDFDLQNVDNQRISTFLADFEPTYGEASLVWYVKLNGEEYVKVNPGQVPATIDQASTDDIEDLIAVVTAENGDVAGVGYDSNNTYYTVTLPDGVSAYYDAAHTTEAAPVVNSNDTLYLVADGDVTLANNGSALTLDNPSTVTGKTTATLSSIAANVNVTVTSPTDALSSAKQTAINTLQTAAGANKSDATVLAVLNAGIDAINAATTTQDITNLTKEYKDKITAAIAGTTFTTATALSGTDLTTALNSDPDFSGVETYVTGSVTATKDTATGTIKVAGRVTAGDQYTTASGATSVPGFGDVSDYLNGATSTKVAFIAVQIDNTTNDVIILIVGDQHPDTTTVTVSGTTYTIDLTGVTFA
jgi:hypothetical protein